MNKTFRASLGNERKESGARTAIVLGGSMAGIWTARVLAELFRRFIVVERDERVPRLFLDVSHLMRPPTDLFMPGTLWRVLRQTLLPDPFRPGSSQPIHRKAQAT